MINTLVSSDAHLQVFGGHSIPSPYSNSLPLSGTLRYCNGGIDVYDGQAWMTVSTNVSVGLSASANDAISWAITKMLEERNWEVEAKKNESVRLAYENMKTAEKQLKTTLILSKEVV